MPQRLPIGSQKDSLFEGVPRKSVRSVRKKNYLFVLFYLSIGYKRFLENKKREVCVRLRDVAFPYIPLMPYPARLAAPFFFYIFVR
jgi:hypothetical protein